MKNVETRTFVRDSGREKNQFYSENRVYKAEKKRGKAGSF